MDLESRRGQNDCYLRNSLILLHGILIFEFYHEVLISKVHSKVHIKLILSKTINKFDMLHVEGTGVVICTGMHDFHMVRLSLTRAR